MKIEVQIKTFRSENLELAELIDNIIEFTKNSEEIILMKETESVKIINKNNTLI